MVFVTLLSLHSPHSWAFQDHGGKDVDIYRKFENYLMASIHRYHPESTVEFTAINFTDEDCEGFLKHNPNIVFNKLNEDFTKHSQEWYKGYLMHNRTLYIKKALKKHKKSILYLDTDCMLRGKVDLIFQKLNGGFDFAVLLRPEQPAKTKVNAGIVGFSNTPKSLKLVDSWLDCIGKDFGKILTKNIKGRNTAGDQRCLWEVYNRSSVRLFKLPVTYNDGLLDKKSIIWHGRSGNKIKALKSFTKDFEERHK